MKKVKSLQNTDSSLLLDIHFISVYRANWNYEEEKFGITIKMVKIGILKIITSIVLKMEHLVSTVQ